MPTLVNSIQSNAPFTKYSISIMFPLNKNAPFTKNSISIMFPLLASIFVKKFSQKFSRKFRENGNFCVNFRENEQISRKLFNPKNSNYFPLTVPQVMTFCAWYNRRQCPPSGYRARVGWYWNCDKRQVGICSIPCKSMGNSNKSFFNQSTFIAEVITFRVMQYIRIKNFLFTM
jgi:hypothetical protein